MRDIKFRAWDSKINRMSQQRDLYGMGMQVFGSPHFKHMHFMQYTGLKDKNGKEIYEGDIVRARSKYVNAVYEVYWDDRVQGFRCCANHDKQYDKTHDMMWADEVIGNIYENEGLLK